MILMQSLLACIVLRLLTCHVILQAFEHCYKHMFHSYVKCVCAFSPTFLHLYFSAQLIISTTEKRDRNKIIFIIMSTK